MSVRTMAKVWEGSQHGGTELLMLLAIADFADDNGNAYPSVATLAAKCRMKPRNANYVLSALQASGELKVMLNGGPRGANRYRVMFDALGVQDVAGVQSLAGVQPSAPTPAKDCAKPLHPIADKPSLNHQEPPSTCAKRSTRKRSEALSMSQWHEAWKASKAEGEKVLLDTDPLFSWGKEVGISYDLLCIAWNWFRDYHLEDAPEKKQKDWRATFRKYVRQGWCGLWYRKDGVYHLNAKGKTAAQRYGYDENLTSGGRDPWAGAI